MAHAAGMAPENAVIAVIDFRRRRMVLQWHSHEGGWTALDDPPMLVHGIALIRASPPNICLFGHGGRLRLQIGTNQFALAENSPRISCSRRLWSLGLRNRFVVRSSTGGILFSHAYWAGNGPDFFRWLARVAEDPDWRATTGRSWSDGLSVQALRGA